MTDVLTVYMGPEALPRIKRKQTEGGWKWSGPLLPRKNDYWAVSRGGIVHPTPLAKEFRKKLRGQLTADGFDLSGEPLINEGSWRFMLITFVGRQYKKGLLAGTPILDSDACLSPVRDALEEANVLPGDKQKGDGLIDADMTVRLYRKDRPGILFELRRCGMGELSNFEELGRRAQGMMDPRLF